MTDSDLKLCPKCGAPQEQAKECLWLNSGAIVLAADMMRRQCLIESENLDRMFAVLKEMGMRDIHDVVIGIARSRRAGRTRENIPAEVRSMVRNGLLSLEALFPNLRADTRFHGFGDCKLGGFRYEDGGDNYLTIEVSNCYSQELFLGAFVGLCEAFLDLRLSFAVKDLSKNLCEMQVLLPGESTPFVESLPGEEYCHRDGDIELERCAKCGSPALLSGFTWNPTAGIIRNSIGSRMVILDPQVLDMIFKEAEERLGRPASAAIIDCQRRFTHSRGKVFYRFDVDEIRAELAVRGLGELKEFEVDSSRLAMRIDNAACPLIVAGSMQALFESCSGRESMIDWESPESGTLAVEVTAARS
jgi:hypothetical protein